MKRSFNVLFLFPATGENTTNIYKIPLSCLAGQILPDPMKRPSIAATTLPQPQTYLAPLMSIDNAGKVAKSGRRSPLLRTKRLGPVSTLPYEVGRYALLYSAVICKCALQ